MMTAPKLRFKNLSGNEFPIWNKRKLLELSEGGFSNGVFNDPKKIGSGYRLINVLDMYIPSTIDESKLSRVAISEAEFKNNKVEHGDIFFTRSSLVKEGIAFSNVYLGNSDDITYDGHLIRLRPKKDLINSTCFNYLLRSKSVRNQLVMRGKTATMTTIGQADIATVEVKIPSVDEQIRIASFLSAVDQKISLLTKRHQLLIQYKKGVMQKIFNQEFRFQDKGGKDYPEWDLRKIGDTLTIGSGRDYKHLSPGNIPVYGTGGFMLSVNDFLYDGVSACIGRKGTIDKPVLLSGKFWTVDTLFYTHKFIDCSPEFIYACFQMINWKSYCEASGVPSLSKSTIEAIEINLPCIAEQKKITDFLAALDNKISNIKSKLALFKQYKQGLLQQMFI